MRSILQIHAYSTDSLVTKNSKERVQMDPTGLSAFSSLLIQSLTIGFVEAMDGVGHGCGETAATAYAVIDWL